MKATSADRVPPGTGWAAEIKWDGMRIEATISRSTAKGDTPTMMLRSSNGRDVTGSFPELAGLAEALQADAVLDGEVVVFDGDRPSFGRLQQRIHIDRPHSTLVESHPVVYIVFDLLRLDGNLLVDLPYRTRRRLLHDLLPDGANWRTPSSVDDPEALLELAAERDLEGIVVKRLDSVYQPGVRSNAWRKVKIRRRQEFVVGGWLEGQRSLEKQLGSLMVGVWDSGRLVMAGRVGSGLTEVERTRLERLLVVTDKPPFAEVPPLDKRPVWVEPTVVVEVEYGEWPPGGQLRHPVYRGLRIDRDPADVTRE